MHAFAPLGRLGAALVLAAALLTLAGCRSVDASSASPEPDRRSAGQAAAAEALRSWDRARGRAFARGDLAALRRLYVPGSRAGTADVRLLRGYLRRGLRIEGMRIQLLEVVVLRREPELLQLRVTDRLAAAVAVGPGSRTALPRDRASTHLVELRREPGSRWRVAGVSAWSAPRPAAR